MPVLTNAKGLQITLRLSGPLCVRLWIAKSLIMIAARIAGADFYLLEEPV